MIQIYKDTSGVTYGWSVINPHTNEIVVEGDGMDSVDDILKYQQDLILGITHTESPIVVEVLDR